MLPDEDSASSRARATVRSSCICATSCSCAPGTGVLMSPDNPNKTMGYEGDAFISYAHLDNRVLFGGTDGLGCEPAAGARNSSRRNSRAAKPTSGGTRSSAVTRSFPTALIDRLRKVAALVPIVSPGYVNSKWGRRELTEFCRAAEAHGGIKRGERSRVFKVLKTQVPLRSASTGTAALSRLRVLQDRSRHRTRPGTVGDFRPPGRAGIPG